MPSKSKPLTDKQLAAYEADRDLAADCQEDAEQNDRDARDPVPLVPQRHVFHSNPRML